MFRFAFLFVVGCFAAALALEHCAAGATSAAVLPSKTIYNFSGGSDGSNPTAVIANSHGILFGTTTGGGDGCVGGCGTVFELKPDGNRFKHEIIYNFKGGLKDGANPSALVEDRAGNLFGVTRFGGSRFNYGVVFELARSGSRYEEVILHRFTGGADGQSATNGLVCDAAGTLYGSSGGGGAGSDGVIFKLERTASGYSFNVIFAFNNKFGYPGPVSIDQAGNIYAFVSAVPLQVGALFKLTPIAGAGYAGQVLYQSSNLGYATGYPIVDGAGNILGITAIGGKFGSGTAFELTPSSSGYVEDVLHNFGKKGDGFEPAALYAANDVVYGVTNSVEASILFSLTESSSGYAYSPLYNFGIEFYPLGFTVVGSPGVLYGTLSSGGLHGLGSVYSIAL